MTMTNHKIEMKAFNATHIFYYPPAVEKHNNTIEETGNNVSGLALYVINLLYM